MCPARPSRKHHSWKLIKKWETETNEYPKWLLANIKEVTSRTNAITRQANAFMLNITLPVPSGSRQMSNKVTIVARGRKNCNQWHRANRITRTSIIAIFNTGEVSEKKPGVLSTKTKVIAEFTWWNTEYCEVLGYHTTRSNHINSGSEHTYLIP